MHVFKRTSWHYAWVLWVIYKGLRSQKRLLHYWSIINSLSCVHSSTFGIRVHSQYSISVKVIDTMKSELFYTKFPKALWKFHSVLSQAIFPSCFGFSVVKQYVWQKHLCNQCCIKSDAWGQNGKIKKSVFELIKESAAML